jgi:hypothetical protein
MSRTLIRASALLAVAASSAFAQTKIPTGAFITRLGSDTIGAERYVVTNSTIEGDVVLRSPRVTVTHYVGDLAPDGSIKRMVMSTRIPGDTASSPRTLLVEEFGDTATYVRVMRNGRPDTVNTGWRNYKGRATPMIMIEPNSYGLYEYVLRSSKLVRDSVAYVFIGANKTQQPTLWVVPAGKDSVAFTNTIFPGWTEMARVDSRGRIQAVNAGRTTVKTIAQRVNDVDIDKLATAWKAYETAHGMMGRTSPLDTTRASVGAANIEIVYSRPSKRGRQIFGTDVVPFGTVWRTGANAATQITTSSDLMFGSTLLPAGKYTLFSLPTATGSKLIISKKTGEWGTDYDATQDFARLDLQTKMLTAPVETFTFHVDPTASGGILRFAWDDREYSIPFTVR